MNEKEDSNKYKKKYKCTYCGESFIREDLSSHIDEEHGNLLPKDFSSSRMAFNIINKKDHGICVVCKKETKWNEESCKYDRLCENPKCRETLRKNALSNMIKVYKKPTLLGDENHQQKMLANRSISGTYTFKDGGKRTFTGQYEKKTLEFFDTVLNVNSKDIITPGPTLEYKFEGKVHKWITDIYYIPHNLIIEVKDGGSNPNNREMPIYRDKQVAKEKMITNMGEFNYLRLTNNNFGQLLEVFAELKARMFDDSANNKKTIVKINESGFQEMNVPGGIPLASAMDNDGVGDNYCIGYSYKNFPDDEIEGFALCDDILNDKVLIVDEGVVRSTSYDFLDNRKLSFYKFKGDKENFKSILQEVAYEKQLMRLPVVDNKMTNIHTMYVNTHVMNIVKPLYYSSLLNFALSIFKIFMPLNILERLRMYVDQSCALDIIDFDITTKKYRKGNTNDLSDHYIYEREVQCVADGEVVGTRYSRSDISMLRDGNDSVYGNYIIIKHEGFNFSLYAHLAENSLVVDIGDKVKKGQVIGKVGNSGNSSTPHLHFQLCTIDPQYQTNPIFGELVSLIGKPLIGFESFKNSIIEKDKGKLLKRSLTIPSLSDLIPDKTDYEINNTGKIYNCSFIKSMKNDLEDQSYFYERLTGREMLSKDQLDYDTMFSPIKLESIQSKIDTYKTTLLENYTKLTNPSKIIHLPLTKRKDIAIKEEMLKEYKHLTILEDVNGYYLYNNISKERSKSFKNINSIRNLL